MVAAAVGVAEVEELKQQHEQELSSAANRDDAMRQRWGTCAANRCTPYTPDTHPFHSFPPPCFPHLILTPCPSVPLSPHFSPSSPCLCRLRQELQLELEAERQRDIADQIASTKAFYRKQIESLEEDLQQQVLFSARARARVCVCVCV